MEHIDRLNKHIEQGTLIRNRWHGEDGQGRETACLLAAMVPQCGIDRSSASCPAEVMPAWLARLTPDLDDRGSLGAWPGMVRRYAGLAAQWCRLDEAAWLRVRYRFLAATVREARSHTVDVSVHEVCDTVIALCEDVVRTGVIDADAFNRARAAAREAAAARVAAEAWAAAAAARVAAEAAAEAAAASAEAAAASAEAAEAWAAAAAAKWDRVTIALFEAIELELGS